MARYTKTEQADARAQLLKFLKPGDTVYHVLESASRSGMSREIKSYAIVDGQPQYLSGWMGVVLGYSRGKRDGLKVGGCGMDMGFHLAYSLARALWPAAVCTGEGCPSNDHANGDRDYTAGKAHGDSGYMLRSEWL